MTTARTGGPPSGLRSAFTLAGKDLRRSVKSRSLVLTAVVGPLALGLIMSLAFGGQGGPSATIAVVDRDGSATSRAVVAGLRRDLAGTSIQVRRVEGDPVAEVRAERADAALVLPAGYGASLAARPATLQVVRNPDRAIAGEVAASIADGLASRADLVRASVATALASGAGPPEVVARAAGAVRPVVEVQVSDLTQRFNAPLYFGPLTIFLFLAMGGAARALVREDAEGTLDRIRAAPLSPTAIVSGSSLGVFAQGLAASLVVYGVSSVFFGARWGSPDEVVVVLVALVVALSGLAAVIVALSRTQAQAEGWNTALAFVLGILGGAFFGGARFPGLVGALGSLTPNGLAMQALVELGPGQEALVDVLPQLLGLVAIGLAGLLVGGRIMRRRLG